MSSMPLRNVTLLSSELQSDYLSESTGHRHRDQELQPADYRGSSQPLRTQHPFGCNSARVRVYTAFGRRIYVSARSRRRVRDGISTQRFARGSVVVQSDIERTRKLFGGVQFRPVQRDGDRVPDRPRGQHVGRLGDRSPVRFLNGDSVVPCDLER